MIWNGFPRYMQSHTYVCRCVIQYHSILVTVLKKQDQLRQKVVKIEATVDSSIDKIKSTTISKQEIEKMYNGILNTCEGLMVEIRHQQEQERREEEEVKPIKNFLTYI